jgi:hypothetical protein
VALYRGRDSWQMYRGRCKEFAYAQYARSTHASPEVASATLQRLNVKINNLEDQILKRETE